MESEALAALIRATIAISTALLVIIAIRRPARRWLGPDSAYALWLLAPLSVIAVLLPARRIDAAVLAYTDYIETSGSLDAATPTQLLALSGTPSLEMSAVALEYWAPISIALWLAGVIASVGFLFWQQQRFCLALGELQPTSYNGIDVYQTHQNGFGPALVGAFPPRLVLPADFDQRYTAKEAALVIAHERAHLARRDVHVNSCAALIRCVFWFNPLVLIAGSRMREDQEIACDASVLEHQKNAQADYGRALLKTQLAAQHLPLGCAWPATGRHPLTERIVALGRKAPGGVQGRVGTLLVLCLSASAAAAAWGAQTPVVTQAKPNDSTMVRAVNDEAENTGGSFIDSLASAGFTGLTADQLISLKIHAVDPQMIQTIRGMGFDPTTDDLIAMAVAEVTPAFVESVRSQGWRAVTMEQLVAMRQMNVQPGEAKQFEHAGIDKPNIDQLIRLSALQVSVDYISSLRRSGVKEKDPEAFMAAAAQGVTPDFVAAARRHGFSDLTLDKLTRLKSADVF